jgi:hypothetical protein
MIVNGRSIIAYDAIQKTPHPLPKHRVSMFPFNTSARCLSQLPPIKLICDQMLQMLGNGVQIEWIQRKTIYPLLNRLARAILVTDKDRYATGRGFKWCQRNPLTPTPPAIADQAKDRSRAIDIGQILFVNETG